MPDGLMAAPGPMDANPVLPDMAGSWAPSLGPLPLAMNHNLDQPCAMSHELLSKHLSIEHQASEIKTEYSGVGGNEIEVDEDRLWYLENHE